jgi:hypothetical protein
VTVSAAWTGQGDLVRINDHFTVISKATKETSSFPRPLPGSDREPTGHGAGVGRLLFADLFNASINDVIISHG